MDHTLRFVPPATAMALLAFATASAAGQSPNAVSYPFRDADLSASPRIKQLRTAVEAGDSSAVEKFWDTLKDTGTPIVEPLPQSSGHSLVTFVWRGAGDTRNVIVIDGVATAVGGLDPQRSQLTRLLDTDVWYRTYNVRNDARFHYWLIPNSTRTSVLESNPESRGRPDPLNPRRLGGLSYIELPEDSGASFTTASQSVPRGKVERSKFHSETLNNDRDVWVYTPPRYQPSGPRYPLLVMFDGGAYLDQVPVPVILDNLIAQNHFPPMVAALVGNAVGRRDAELACDKPFAEFLATELVPWMRKNYDATDDPSRTVVGGSSRGGLASAFAGFNIPRCSATFCRNLVRIGGHRQTNRSGPG